MYKKALETRYTAMLYIPSDPLSGYRPLHLSRGAAKESRFKLCVNGVSCPVRLSRESKMPFNRVWPGYQRPLDQTEQGEFCVFYGEGAVTVNVTLSSAPELLDRAVLRPLSKGVRPEPAEGGLSFTLTENGYYSLEAGSVHDSVQIFYCPPLSDDGGRGADIAFGPGVHFPGKMNVKSGDRIYIHPEAVVYGSVLGQDVQNVTLYGGGVLDDSTEERVFEDSYAPESSGCVRFFRSKSIYINDIICLNASNWVISTFDCGEVHIDGVKILGQWRYNTDGIDLVNARACSIRRCFVRSFDDTIVLKALYQYPAMEDITVEDCVLWCGWGKTLEIGLETSADEYRNIRFKNCELIHNSVGAMAVSNGNYARIHDITYENIGIEYAADEVAGVYQQSDDMAFVPAPVNAHADVFRLSNWRMWEAYPYVDIAGDRKEQYGRTENIRYKNIRILSEDGNAGLHGVICSHDPNAPVRGLTIEGLYINGERQTGLENINLSISNAEAPVIK